MRKSHLLRRGNRWALVVAAGASPLLLAAAASAQTFAVSIGVRETGVAGTIGGNGGSVGGIEWINLDGLSLTADGTWQQFTFNFGTDPVQGFAGATANGILEGQFGTLEHIRIRNSSVVTDRITMHVDDVVNTVSATPTVVSGFEETDPFPTTALGIEHMIQEPQFSGSTQAFINAGGITTNNATVTDQQFHSGARSDEIFWTFNGSGGNTAWLRLTTFNSTGQPNPTIDFSPNNTLSFWLRAVIAPPEQRWINPGSGDWDDVNNWGTGVVPNANTAVANFLEDITSPAVVNLNNPIIINTIRLKSEHGYTISGANTLTFDGTAESARTVNAEVGNHTLSAPMQIDLGAGTSGLMNFNVTRAQDTLNVSGPITINILGAQTLTVQKQGPGQLNISRIETADPFFQPTNILASGGTMRLIAGSGRTRVNDMRSAGGLTPTAKIDITDNPVVVDYLAPPPGAEAEPFDTIKAQIASAYNGGAWDGNGIGSSLANSSTHGVGYAEAAALPSVPAIFGTIDGAEAVLIRLTRYGDANLDGQVNLQDFNRLAANFGTTTAGWDQGDFNYDSQVNLQDFNRLAANFGLAATGRDAPTAEDWATLAAAVPEPGVALVAGVGAVGLLARRRRR